MLLKVLLSLFKHCMPKNISTDCCFSIHLYYSQSVLSLSGQRVWLCMPYSQVPLILTAARLEKGNQTLRTTRLRLTSALRLIQKLPLFRKSTVSTRTRFLMGREDRQTAWTLGKETGYGNTYETT